MENMREYRFPAQQADSYVSRNRHQDQVASTFPRPIGAHWEGGEAMMIAPMPATPTVKTYRTDLLRKLSDIDTSMGRIAVATEMIAIAAFLSFLVRMLNSF